MSRDPYIDVKADVETNLQSLSSLLSDSSTSTSLTSEIRETINLLEADIDDLENSVRAVEAAGDRWGIGEAEKRGRRHFVDRVKREVDQLKSRFRSRGDQGGSSRRKDGKGYAAVGDGRYADDPDEAEGGRARGGRGANGDDEDEARRWEMEEQQMLVRRQDDTLGVISGTLHNLASQAGLIGHEVAEQGEMLDDLGNRVDDTDNRLKRVSKRMQEFVRRNEETKSGYCICILIVILIILLVLVILT